MAEEKEMTRTLYSERTYNLGNYQSVKFSNALTGIPKEMAFDAHLVGLLYYNQIVEQEYAYRKYYQLIETIARDKVVDILGFLETEREQTLQELSAKLKDYTNSSKEPEKQTE